jgi:hypothetical protein
VADRSRLPWFIDKVSDVVGLCKTPAIKRRLAAHPRFVLYSNPTSSSWLNLLEHWFGELTTSPHRVDQVPLQASPSTERLNPAQTVDAKVQMVSETSTRPSSQR